VDDVTALAVAGGGGDRMALAAFVRATQPDVWRFCAHLGGGDSTDDWVQETYLRALRALPAFRGDAPARVWLLAIARRVAADAIRANVRRRRLLWFRTAPVPVADASAHVDPHLLLGGLDEDRRVAFVLTQVLGLTYAEAASACDCPIGTIRSRVARAREQLVAEWTAFPPALGDAASRE
jgi:RNA polymerase sigma-70 factor (ECF subfamily)